jgi:hypothetical protein
MLTEGSFRFRFYYLFPMLLLCLTYFAFVHRWKETKKTGFEELMFGFSKGVERFKAFCVVAIGLLFIPWGISWTASDALASIAYLVSNKPHTETYKVVDIKSTRNLLEVKLLILSNNETAYIRAPYDWFEKDLWRSGTIVNVKSRTSVLGTIVEKATPKINGVSQR